MTHEEKVLWGIIPTDCKRALARLRELGLMEAARAEVIANAQARLERSGCELVLINCCHALELAAEDYLKAHGYSLTTPAPARNEKRQPTSSKGL